MPRGLGVSRIVGGRRVVKDVQPSFSGGLNLTADPAQLKATEMRQAVNARLSDYGAVKKRGPTQRTSAAAILASNSVKGGHAWVRSASVVEVAITNGRVDTGTYAIPMTWTNRAAATTIAAAVYPSFASFRDASADMLYIADGGALNKMSTAFAVSADLAGTPNVSVIAVQNQRLFGVGDTANPETLYWSAINNGDTLGIAGSNGGSAVIRTFGMRQLTGLLALGESLLIFHRTGISRFTGWSADDISIESGTRGVAADVGTIAPQSIISVENVGYFVSDRGVFQVTEGAVQVISTPIDLAVFSNASTDLTLFTRAKAVHHKAYREVWFYFPDIGWYVFNYQLRAWTGPMTGLGVPHSAWPSFDAAGKPIVLVGAADGFVRQVDAPLLPGSGVKDDILSDGTVGSAFTMTVQMHRMFFGSPTTTKSVRRAYFAGGPFPTTTTLTAGTPLGASALAVPVPSGEGGSNTAGVTVVEISGQGRYADPVFVDAGTGGNISVYSRLELEAYDMGQR